MTKYARPLILALALLALGASITALYVHYQILKDPTYTSFCDINETVSCEAVLESPYATVRGVPVAAGGAIWSTLVLLIAAFGLRRDNTDANAAAAGYIFVLATVGLSAVLYLGYASFFVIGKMCPICLTMYVSVIGVFLVSGGELRTPALDVGILDGITRAFVLRLAREHGVACRETRFSPADLRAADEVFVTSATRFVLPVTRVDDVVIGDGRPGPITRRLGAWLDELARAGGSR